jgi:hypothetical protein
MSQPALYRLLTFHIPNLMSIFLGLGHLSKDSIQVRGSLRHFVRSLFFMVKSCKHHAQPTSWRTTPCWLSVTAYSIDLQLPSKSGVRLFIPQPEDVPCCGDKGPTKHGPFRYCDQTFIYTSHPSLECYMSHLSHPPWYSIIPVHRNFKTSAVLCKCEMCGNNFISQKLKNKRKNCTTRSVAMYIQQE